MSLFSLPRTYGNILRFREIATVLVRHGFGHLVARLRLESFIPGLSRLRLVAEGGRAATAADQPPAERLVRVLQDLGPTFIKFGQLLANRPDLMPPEYLEPLSRLRDRVEPFPSDEAVATIEDRLQEPLDQMFAEFDRTPVASGSVGQVHHAMLRTGEPVVVKVKRPGTDHRIREDLDIMLWLAGLVERHIEELAVIKPRMLCEEFARAVRREIDFVTEASYTAKMATQFQDDPSIHIPKVYWQYVTRDVLVLERIQGRALSGPDMQALPREERARLAKVLGRAFMKQFFVTGVFHADPHLGNLFLLADGRLALIDFGQMGHLSAEVRHQITIAFLALNEGDFDTVADVLADLGGTGDNAHTAGFKTDLITLVDRYYGVPLDRMDFRQVFDEMVATAREHGVVLPRNLVLMGKSLSTAIGVAQTLDPEFRIDEVARPFTRKIVQSWLRPLKIMRGGAFSAYRLVQLLQRAPADLRELMQKAKSGNLRVIFHHEALESFAYRIDRAFSRLSLALILAAIIVGSSMVMTSQPVVSKTLPAAGGVSVAAVFAIVGFGIATLMGLWLVWRIFRSDRH